LEEVAMNDDLSRKVQQIAQLLGRDSVPDNVKELISLLAGSGDSSSKADASAATTQPATPGQSNPEEIQESIPVLATAAQTATAKATASQDAPENPSSINQDVINSARNALNRLNTANDPRINLLNAIKPFMNSRRQKKISSCIQLLQIASISRLLNEHEKQTR